MGSGAFRLERDHLLEGLDFACSRMRLSEVG